MNTERLGYLNGIGIYGGLLTQVETAISFWESLLSRGVSDIFVCEDILKDGTREYTSLWGFTDGFFMEAKNFVAVKHFDVAPLSHNVRRLEIMMRDYEEHIVANASRVDVQVALQSGIMGTFKATGNNCQFLMSLVRQWLAPNLIGIEVAPHTPSVG